MNKVIRCPEELPIKDDIWVFLMGPIQGAPDWHSEIEMMPKIPGVTFLSPRRKNNPVGSEDLKKVFSDEDYKVQVEWETMGLRYCDIILCWIPKPAEDIPGRSYAQTTRFELGENLARGKKFVFGCDPEIPGRRYFQQKLKTYYQNIENLNKPYETLEDCMFHLVNKVKEIKDITTTWFTSDTHFSSQTALDYSKRPFINTDEMNTKLIENWNNSVSPWDTIYHLGDVGDTNFIKYLNGKKILVKGNYDIRDNEVYIKAGFCKVIEGVEIIDTINRSHDRPALILSHTPEVIKEYMKDKFHIFGLFGHTHGRQRIKKWGGIDVGVDCNNFTPISLEDVMFYYRTILGGYYDKEVWC